MNFQHIDVNLQSQAAALSSAGLQAQDKMSNVSFILFFYIFLLLVYSFQFFHFYFSVSQHPTHLLSLLNSPSLSLSSCFPTVA
jgi:hypothetical protein